MGTNKVAGQGVPVDNGDGIRQTAKITEAKLEALDDLSLSAHAARHQNGSADEISVAGLSGELADAQPPKTHASNHQNSGSDEVATATPAANAIPKADANGKLDSWITGTTGDAGEGHISIFPRLYVSTTAGDWVYMSSTLPLGGYFYNSAHNDADDLTYRVFLAAGTYSMQLWYYASNNRGILKADIGGGTLASFDMYAASDNSDAVLTVNNISIGSSGVYTLTLKVDGKRVGPPASTDYYAAIYLLNIYRTA